MTGAVFAGAIDAAHSESCAPKSSSGAPGGYAALTAHQVLGSIRPGPWRPSAPLHRAVATRLCLRRQGETGADTDLGAAAEALAVRVAQRVGGGSALFGEVSTTVPSAMINLTQQVNGRSVSGNLQYGSVTARAVRIDAFRQFA